MIPRLKPLALLLALPLWSLPALANDEDVMVLADATPAAPKAAPVVEKRIVITRVGQDGTPLPPPPVPPMPPIPPLPGNVEIIRLHAGPAGLPGDDAETVAFADGDFGPHGGVVTGLPFSAEAVSEKVQVLADGNRIVRKSTTRLYRDGQGRKRYEMLADDGSVRTAFVYDPVSKMHYTMNPGAKTATKLSMKIDAAAIRAAQKAMEASRKAEVASQKAVEAARHAAAAAEKAGEKHAQVERRVVVIRDANGVQTRFDSHEGASPESAAKPIGSKEIDGIKVEGTRSTRTIAAGAIGNEKPIQFVSERFYSPELKVVMATYSRDPRYGESSYRLGKVKRGEPDAALFAPPAGFKVHDILLPPKPPAPPAPPAPPKAAGE